MSTEEKLDSLISLMIAEQEKPASFFNGNGKETWATMVGKWVIVGVFLLPILYGGTFMVTQQAVASLKADIQSVQKDVTHLNTLLNKDLDHLVSRVDQHDDRLENITSRIRILEDKVLRDQ